MNKKSCVSLISYDFEKLTKTFLDLVDLFFIIVALLLDLLHGHLLLTSLFVYSR